MIETANSKQTKYWLYVLCLLIQCDDCNHINRNTSIMQYKCLSNLWLLDFWLNFQGHNRSITDKREPDSIYFCHYTCIWSSPPARINWKYNLCTHKVARTWWPWYFSRSQQVINFTQNMMICQSMWMDYMLRFSKIWLENAQMKLTRPLPHFKVTRDFQMLKFDAMLVYTMSGHGKQIFSLTLS